MMQKDATAGQPGNSDAATSWASALGVASNQQTGNDRSQTWDKKRMMAAYALGQRMGTAAAATAALWQQQQQLPWNANGSVAPEGTPPSTDAQDSWSWAWQPHNTHDNSGTGSSSWGETPQWWPGPAGDTEASAEPADPTSASSTMAEGDLLKTSEQEDRTHNHALNLLRQMKEDGVAANATAHSEEEQDSDEDDGLAQELSSAVALFLAGEDDTEKSDAEADGHPANLPTSTSSPPASVLRPVTTPGVRNSAEMNLSSLPAEAVSAAPFVPAAAASMSAANLAGATRHAAMAAAPISLSSAIPTTPITTKHPRGISLADALAGEPPSDAPAQTVAMMPTQEGLNDFLSVLRRRSLPPELHSEGKIDAFKATISATLLDLHEDRTRPTLGVLQRRLRDRGCSEASLQAVLSVCARDTPEVFQIHPPMNGEQPIVYLSNEPPRFEGFVDVEAPEEQQLPLANSKWEAFEEFLRDDKLLLPSQLNQAALVLRDKVPRFNGAPLGELEHLVRLAIGKRKLLAYCGDGLRPTRVVRSLMKQRNQERLSSNFQGSVPATPGALVPRGPQASVAFQSEGQPRSKADKSVEQRLEKPAGQPVSLTQPVSPVADKSEQVRQKDRTHDSEAGKPQMKAKENTSVSAYKLSNKAGESPPIQKDVSGLLSELMLAFPHGMKFNQLKYHLKELSDGNFSETAYTCRDLAHVPEMAGQVESTCNQKAREMNSRPERLNQRASRNTVSPSAPIGSQI
eukprot:TRINITY_DN27329_c0_g2_i1.p1 TRINITY_DN27329_c0_g2~~TRINITY_DN27329_c0_g2_i1.p1  ORF type:complete len:743 (+),score=137.78 TRINITY_DN27329_c0_g2_i1:102-2330(+)